MVFELKHARRYTARFQDAEPTIIRRYAGGVDAYALLKLVNNFAQLHDRPIGVDGDVGAVVVEDGAGAVDDFLISESSVTSGV